MPKERVPIPRVYEEFGKGGGSVIPNYLKPAMQKVLDEMATGSILPRSMMAGRGSGKTQAAKIFAAAYRGIPRTPATGIVHKWERPFPYGTVIRPTTFNLAYNHSRRHMILGPSGSVTKTLNLNGIEGDFIEYDIPTDELHEWEEVPD